MGLFSKLFKKDTKKTPDNNNSGEDKFDKTKVRANPQGNFTYEEKVIMYNIGLQLKLLYPNHSEDGITKVIIDTYGLDENIARSYVKNSIEAYKCAINKNESTLICAICGKSVITATDKQFLAYAMSDGDDRAFSIAFYCKNCNKVYCSGCMVEKRRTCPDCSQGVVNYLER